MYLLTGTFNRLMKLASGEVIAKCVSDSAGEYNVVEQVSKLLTVK